VEPALHIKGTHDVVIEGISLEPSSTPLAGGTAIVVEDAPDVVVQDNVITDFQFGVIIHEGDEAEVRNNDIFLPADVGGRGVSSVNGHGVEILDNRVSGGVMGVFCGGLHGRCSGNLVGGATLGFILCKVREGVFDIAGNTAGTEFAASGWYVANNVASQNQWGYLVIDGATENTLVNNIGSDNARYDLELAGDSERFGFFTPPSSENVVIQDAGNPLIIKDCGQNNMVSGEVILVDKEVDLCF
jgi:hypothetical protein